MSCCGKGDYYVHESDGISFLVLMLVLFQLASKCACLGSKGTQCILLLLIPLLLELLI